MSNTTTPYNYTASAAELQAIIIEEASCYSLPFGGIGFASHMLTYYTAVMLYLGRQPLRPWKQLAHKRFDLILGSVQLVITIVLTSISISRCWRSWPFGTLGVWMLTTSVCVSVLPMLMSFVHNQVLEVERTDNDGLKVEVATRISLPSTKRILIWPALLWILGSFADVAGTIMISLPNYMAEAIDHRFGPLFILTTVFAGLLMLPLILMIWSCCVLEANAKFIRGVLVYVVLGVTVLALPWMDWALGLISGNMAGIPSGDAKTLYYCYVVAKRLGMLLL
ncbi:hypothetical protein PG988_001491 [Apiospora saccharicola]